MNALLSAAGNFTKRPIPMRSRPQRSNAHHAADQPARCATARYTICRSNPGWLVSAKSQPALWPRRSYV